ncbi:ankyrin repeat domain-containing protein [Tenacibaculum halocynthiae]|uniref:ankyrin repeat domain-containing protein n=1 Tax=Tenacibaculum halocynthiae TaxID=1254437 RepID=UPI003895B390
MKRLLLIIISSFTLSSCSQDNCKKLLDAVNKRNITQVRTLLRTTNPNCSYRGLGEPRSPLVSAARKGDLTIGKLLISYSASTEYHSSGDETPLIAASANGHLNFVSYLIKKGAKINKQVNGDGTALIAAVRNNHYKIAEILLKNGADPMLNSPGDEYPMYHAISTKNEAMITLLKKYIK